MRTAIGFLLLCLSPLALAQDASIRGDAVGPPIRPQGKQYLVRESSRGLGRAGRLLDVYSLGFDPWVKQVTGAPNRHTGCMMYAVDSNTFWSVFEAFDIASQEYVRTTNGGVTWLCDTIHVASPTYKSVSIYAFDANRAWVLMWDRVTQSGGGLFATTDGGATWKENSTVFKKAANGIYGPDFIHFFDADNGVCVGDSVGIFEIYTTSNGGANWLEVPRENIPAKLPDEWGKTHVFTAAGSSLWFPTIGANGRFYKTTDKGLTWSVYRYPKTPLWYFPMIEFQDENVGLGNGDWGDVEKSTDGGVTWTAIPTSMKFAFQDLKYVPHTPGMYVASAVWRYNSLVQQYQYGTLYTLDAGAHWTIASASTFASPPAVWDLPLLSFSTPTSGWQGDKLANVYKWTVPSGQIIGVHPDSLVFSTLESGLKSDTICVDFVNHGSDPVILSSIAIPGTGFTVTKQPTLPVTLSSLASARVELCFMPHRAGSFRDSLVFLSNSSNAPRTSVYLEGKSFVVVPSANFHVISGSAEVPVAIHVIDNSNVRPDTYIITFDDTSSTTQKTFSVYNRSKGSYPLRNSPLVPKTESMAFDGLALYTEDIATSLSGSRWSRNVNYNRSFSLVPVDFPLLSLRGYRQPCDYKIVFHSAQVDTSVVVDPDFYPSIPIFYEVFNVQTNRKLKVGASESPGLLEVLFMEDVNDRQRLTWDLSMTFQPADSIPREGDTLYLYTKKGFSIYDSLSVSGFTVSVNDKQGLPKEYVVYQNYPNPFNPTTTIRYELPFAAEVSLTIYDLLGREVRMLVHEMQTAGYRSAEWNGQNDRGYTVASGVYFYRLTAGSFVQTKKLLILR